MSFFSSIQQYVTSGVAGLGLSPRKFSLSRQDSAEVAPPPPEKTVHGEFNLLLGKTKKVVPIYCYIYTIYI